MAKDVPTKLNRGENRTDLDNEHHRVLDHRPWFQLAKGVHNGPRQNGAIGERFFSDLTNLSNWVHGHLRKPFLRSLIGARESARDSEPGKM